MNLAQLEKQLHDSSGACYNKGLECASVRDMSGAIVYLKKSLQYNKYNMDARNLLGLVYYEMGEVVEALSEWVISRSLIEEKNPADDYLQRVQKNKLRLHEIEMSLEKYNQALHLVNQGSDDLAILQLNKVISHNPKLLRAYQLLALLYLKTQKYSKAEKTLRKAFTIDRSDTTCLRYMQELRIIARNKAKKKKKKNEPDLTNIEGLSLDDVIIPTYKESTGSWLTIIYLLLGLAVGIACTYFMVMPSYKKQLTADMNAAATTYSEQIAAKDATINELENQISDLEGNVTNLESNISNSKSEVDKLLATYDTLAEVLDMLKSDGDGTSYLEAVTAFLELDFAEEDIPTEQFRTTYNNAKTEIDTNAFNKLLNDYGKPLYDSEEYENAKPYFLKCLDLQPENNEAAYYLAHCYYRQGDNETAVNYFNQIIERGGEYYEDTQAILEQINQ